MEAPVEGFEVMKDETQKAYMVLLFEEIRESGFLSKYSYVRNDRSYAEAEFSEEWLHGHFSTKRLEKFDLGTASKYKTAKLDTFLADYRIVRTEKLEVNQGKYLKYHILLDEDVYSLDVFEREEYAIYAGVLEEIYSKPNSILEKMEAMGILYKTHCGSFHKGSSRYVLIEDHSIIKEWSLDSKVQAEILKRKNKISDNRQKLLNVHGFYFDGENTIDFLKTIVPQGDAETDKQYFGRLNGYKKLIKAIEDDTKHIKCFTLNCGRIFSDLNRFPKEIRKRLKHIDFPICEMDINATIPRLLGVAVEKQILSKVKSAKTSWDNIQKLKDWRSENLSEAEMSKKLKKWRDEQRKIRKEKGAANYRTDFDSYYLRANGETSIKAEQILRDARDWNSQMVNDRDTYLNIIEKLELEIDRGDLKESFLRFVFGTNKDDEKKEYVTQVALAMTEKFPYLSSYLKTEAKKNRDLKSKNHNRKDGFVTELFKLEGSIIKKVLKTIPLENSRFSVYDAIIIATNDDSLKAEIEKNIKVEARKIGIEIVTKRLESGDFDILEEKVETMEKLASPEIIKEYHMEEKLPLSIQNAPLSVQNDSLSVQNDSLSVQNDSLSVQNDSLSVQNDSLSVQRCKATTIKMLSDGRFRAYAKGVPLTSRKGETLDDFERRAKAHGAILL